MYSWIQSRGKNDYSTISVDIRDLCFLSLRLSEPENNPDDDAMLDQILWSPVITKERKKKKIFWLHAISSLPDLVGLQSLFFQASEQQSKSSWNRLCNTWRTNTGDAEHVCSARGTCWDDGHVICALGMMSAVRRKGNKVLGAHNKGLLKVCLLAVVRPKGSVCMVSSNQVPQRICYEDHLKQITTREAE